MNLIRERKTKQIYDLKDEISEIEAKIEDFSELTSHPPLEEGKSTDAVFLNKRCKDLRLLVGLHQHHKDLLRELNRLEIDSERESASKAGMNMGGIVGGIIGLVVGMVIFSGS